MKTRLARRRVIFALVAVAGGVLVTGELDVLSGSVRAAAVPVLAGVGSFDTLVGLLTDDDRDVRTAAQDSLVRAGPSAVPALGPRTGLGRADSDPEVSEEAL